MTQQQQLLLLLGKMNSKRRLATFLLDVSDHMRVQGCSSKNINLSMSRHDIANYLGLAIETVSRILTNVSVARQIGRASCHTNPR